MPAWLGEIPGNFWDVLSEMAPYLLFGFFAAGALSVLISAETVERHLGGRGLVPILKAAAFGVPLPLCSCGVIPVAASLRRHGAGRGATTAFLIATPQDGVDSILVTFSLLGGAFAIFRPIAALLSGLVGGLLVETGADGPRGDGPHAGHEPHQACTDPCCAQPGRNRLYRMLAYGFGDLPRDIGKALLGGLLIAALISSLVPKDFFAQHLGRGLPAMLVMMALGVPVYVCATASVPIAAALVLRAGLSPGAALVFLMTGPATNAATITTVWKVMGRRTALIYLAVVMVSALAAGLTMDYLFQVGGIRAHPGMSWMLPAWANSISAVALLGVLGVANLRPVLRRTRKRENEPEPTMHALKLLVRGMTCTHCVASVRRALLESPGVHVAEVDLEAGEARVSGEGAAPEQLVSAVESLGYEAEVVCPPAAQER